MKALELSEEMIDALPESEHNSVQELVSFTICSFFDKSQPYWYQ